ncbi:DUF421 domain-containing protein [Caldalkalibacillus mannanilyticus]|uniref:DUF421 domain-containing protein n=1 Tax=Caldalkalibacillus mannanilyticus TaxID=1418 RepID=UPI00046A67DF|nr:YetF domain-containing protein [Caldalkalibacillus mannanilyticus]
MIIVIAIGALIGAPLVDDELSPLKAIVAIIGLVIAQMIASWLALKSKFMEMLIMGKPIQLIDQGRILMKGLRKARLTKNDLIQELRIKGVKSIEEVEKAYLEPGGKISMIEKGEEDSG